MNYDDLVRALKDYEKPYQRMEFATGDAGPVPITKVGGAPWWPENEERPICVDGHPMAFVLQVRVDEIPGWNQPPTLLSFHYCDECKLNGNMSFGWDEKGHQLRYNVRLFSTPSGKIDDQGIRIQSSAEPRTVTLLDEFESLSLQHIWEAFPETSEPGRLSGFNENHCYESKLGGWPSWAQSPSYPEDEAGNDMELICQLSGREHQDTAWSCGFVYLFASKYEEGEDQEAEMVLQST